MTDRLFGYFTKRAPKCPKCGERLIPIRIKMGFGDEIIGEYACRNKECFGCRKGLRDFRRLLPSAVREIREWGILSEEDFSFIERQRRAAVAADIRCPVCGYKRRYIDSTFARDGKLLHKFECKNEHCSEFGQGIRLELTEADVRRIESDYAKKNSCSVCGKLSGAKVRCQKHGGFVCMEHCMECESHDERTSQTHCRFFLDHALPDAARKGILEIEKAYREAKEI